MESESTETTETEMKTKKTFDAPDKKVTVTEEPKTIEELEKETETIVHESNPKENQD